MRGRLGIRARLGLAITLVVAGVAVVFALYFPARLAETANSSLRARALSLSNMLASLVTPAVRDEMPEQLHAQLGSAAFDGDLRYAAVVRPDGTLMGQFRSPGSNAAMLQNPGDGSYTESSGGLIHTVVPLRVDNRVIAKLVTGMSRESIEAAQTTAQRTAIAVSALVVLIGFCVAWLVAGSITRPLLDTSGRLSKMADELVGAARAQEAAAAEESAAIEETRATMDMLLTSAQRIAESSSTVLGNAESAAGASRQIAERIADLNAHAEKVSQILASIMQVADRTDLLALNAALEGTKAGDAGKGFTLVANEMRRLAENVMESVNGIRRLMQDVKTASTAAVQSSHGGNELSEQTTRSARDIALVTQQQRQATEQVMRSMDEMTGVLGNTMTNVKNLNTSASALADLAGGLSALINPGRQNRS